MKTVTLFKSMTMGLCCLSSMMFFSCSKDDNKPVVSQLKFNKNSIEVVEGKKTDVRVGGGVAPYTAQTSDAKTATAVVTKDVVTVTGVKKGQATLTVTDKNKKMASLSIVVKDAASVLSFDKEAVSVEAKKTVNVEVKSGTAPYTVVSKDAKTATATVKDKIVTITGVKAGTTTITVTDKDKKTGVITVTVK